METMVSELSVSQLKEIIENALEEKFRSIFDYDDFGYELKESIKERLRHQKEERQSGSSGIALEDVIKQLGITNV